MISLLMVKPLPIRPWPVHRAGKPDQLEEFYLFKTELKHYQTEQDPSSDEEPALDHPILYERARLDKLELLVKGDCDPKEYMPWLNYFTRVKSTRIVNQAIGTYRLSARCDSELFSAHLETLSQELFIQTYLSYEFKNFRSRFLFIPPRCDLMVESDIGTVLQVHQYLLGRDLSEQTGLSAREKEMRFSMRPRNLFDNSLGKIII